MPGRLIVMALAGRASAAMGEIMLEQVLEVSSPHAA